VHDEPLVFGPVTSAQVADQPWLVTLLLAKVDLEDKAVPVPEVAPQASVQDLERLADASPEVRHGFAALRQRPRSVEVDFELDELVEAS